MEKFQNRYAAGKLLAKELKAYEKRNDVMVRALLMQASDSMPGMRKKA